MNILVGTASWAAPSLTDSGLFYPAEVRSPEARLRHYAGLFPLVEIDASYYGIPTAANAERWAARTPEDFVFNMKAFRLFTGHDTPLAVLHRDLQRDLQHELGPGAPPLLREADLPREIVRELWRRFAQALEPLRQAGKLGAVHLQFAPWVRGDAAGRAYVERAAERLEGCDIAIEFRHRSWFEGDAKQATLDLLRGLGAAHVVVDGPQGFANTVPAVWDATNDSLAVVRLHGRNAATWNVRGGVGSDVRFNYDYPDEELESLLAPIRSLAQRVKTTHVVFNNNHEDQGQRNAMTMMKKLLKARQAGAPH